MPTGSKRFRVTGYAFIENKFKIPVIFSLTKLKYLKKIRLLFRHKKKHFIMKLYMEKMRRMPIHILSGTIPLMQNMQNAYTGRW